MNRIVVLLTLGQAFLSQGQAFMRRYDLWDQMQFDSGLGIERATNGGYMVFSGSTYAYDSTVYASIVTALHIDANGVPMDTTKVFQPCCATYPGWANACFQRAGGGYGVGGSKMDTSGTGSPVLYLFDENGFEENTYTYSHPGEIWAGRSGKQTPDAGYVIVGETSSSGTSLDGFLLKIDSLGNQEWIQTYGLSNRSESMTTVDMGPDGGYYIGGQFRVSGDNYDQWLLRVDADGSVVWEEEYGMQYHDPGANVTTTADGNLVFSTGWAQDNNPLLLKALVKVDSLGGIIWSKTYGSSGLSSILFAVKEVLPGGDLIAAGPTRTSGFEHGALLRTNSEGDSLWMRYYHYYDSVWTAGRGLFWDVIPTSDGGFAAVGTANNTSANPNDPPIYSQDTWVVKVDSMGCLEPGCHLITSLQSQVTNLRDALTVAPNPASDVARVTWGLPIAMVGSAQLSVVSAAGQLVNTLPVALSAKSLTLDVTAYPAGLYHLHLVVDGQWVSGCKMIVE